MGTLDGQVAFVTGAGRGIGRAAALALADAGAAVALVARTEWQLSEAQLDGRACIRCGVEALPRRPVEAWSRLSSQLFECVDTAAVEGRRV